LFFVFAAIRSFRIFVSEKQDNEVSEKSFGRMSGTVHVVAQNSWSVVHGSLVKTINIRILSLYHPISLGSVVLKSQDFAIAETHERLALSGTLKFNGCNDSNS
jgi:hypothetical protein